MILPDAPPPTGDENPWLDGDDAGDLRARHAALSATQLRFLDFAAREPECRQPESFSALARPIEVEELPVPHPWPMFLGRGKMAELERASVSVCTLIKQLPQRLFENDPERLAEYYELLPDTALLISSLIRQAGGTAQAVARGDFIETTAGFKCCELNVAGNLGGGWEVLLWAEKYLSVPILRRFLDEQGIAPALTNPLRLMFSHMIDDALARSLPSAGRLDLAILFAPGTVPSAGWQRYVDREYRLTLAERDGGLAGAASCCLAGALALGGGELRLGERRIHLVVDTNDGGPLARPLFLALMADRVRLYNGPASQVLSDKLNLALLSETQDSELWSAEERAAIKAHVPWSRRVSEDFVDFGAERAWMPDLLANLREQLVLKRGLSMKGAHVHSGRFTQPARWQELVREALAERGWMVQERLDPVPYLFQLPAGGAGLHDLVWGLFVYGNRFGGGFLRLLPRGRHDVINYAQGAQVSVFLETAE